MVAVELEVMAKKMDRFGWDRDRGSAAHDRLITDWMDTLQDYPLDEVKAACRAWVLGNPRRMPNEGDIRNEILKARAGVWSERRHSVPPEDDGRRAPTADEKARVADLLKKAGFAPRTMKGTN